MALTGFSEVVRTEKGIALLITLSLVSILTVAALEIARQVAASSEVIRVQESSFKAEQTAMSGIHLAMAVLADDANSNELDSIQEFWADSRKLTLALAQLHPEAESLNLEISDELGKIQINSMISEFPGNTMSIPQRELWERLLSLIISKDKSKDFREPEAILNCIKDWLDSGDDDTITGTSGAESSYYENLDPPVFCSNGPLETLQELFNIKGVSQDMLAVQSIMQEAGLFDTGTDQLPMDTLFTVFGMDSEAAENGGFRFPGTININTADPMVMAAMLPPGQEDQALELADFRAQTLEEGGDFVNTLDKGWYEQVIELSEKEKRDFESIIRYSSNYFRVKAMVGVGAVEHTILATIKREKDTETGRWYCRLIRLSRE